eukprot:5134118-Prymnesium_polylepis.1
MVRERHDAITHANVPPGRQRWWDPGGLVCLLEVVVRHERPAHLPPVCCENLQDGFILRCIRRVDAYVHSTAPPREHGHSLTVENLKLGALYVDVEHVDQARHRVLGEKLVESDHACCLDCGPVAQTPSLREDTRLIPSVLGRGLGAQLARLTAHNVTHVERRASRRDAVLRAHFHHRRLEAVDDVDHEVPVRRRARRVALLERRVRSQGPVAVARTELDEGVGPRRRAAHLFDILRYRGEDVDVLEVLLADHGPARAHSHRHMRGTRRLLVQLFVQRALPRPDCVSQELAGVEAVA